MRLHPQPNGRPTKLPRPVRDYVARRFCLPVEHLETLRCFEYDGTVNGKQARRFRIYSPEMAHQRSIRITAMSHLEEHPALLLFEAYIDREGEAYVADRRTPRHAKRK